MPEYPVPDRDKSAGLDEPNPWDTLRAFTDARIAQGRTGTSLPTRELLAFGQAHAAARDAVHTPADFTPLEQALLDRGETVLHVHSRARDRSEYLRRPDLGRKLNAESRARLESPRTPEEKTASLFPFDIALVVADGLSASGIQHALPVLQFLIPALRERALTLAPVVLAEQGRVALGDDIALALGAKLVLVLIGERPGLSSPDSLGAYLTYDPQLLTRDSARNCVSNIRPAGLDARTAAWRILHLVTEALRRELSGVNLKDDSGEVPATFAALP